MRSAINLLPASFRRQQILRKRCIQWGTAICVVLVIGWISHWCELQEEQAMAQRLESLTREHQPTRVMFKQLMDMRQQLVDLRQQERVAQELEYQRSALAILGVLSHSASQTNGRLRLTKLDVENLQAAHSQDKSGTPDSHSASMSVVGVSLDYASVADLMKGLQDSHYFNHVDLVTSKEREGGNGTLRDFELRCVF